MCVCEYKYTHTILDNWHNDAENSALYHRNKLRFKIYFYIKQFFKL